MVSGGQRWSMVSMVVSGGQWWAVWSAVVSGDARWPVVVTFGSGGHSVSVAFLVSIRDIPRLITRISQLLQPKTTQLRTERGALRND